MDTILIPPSVFDSESESFFPDPQDYTYWEARESRIFYIDWELDEIYNAVELSKIIIQMNVKEKDIPNKNLKPIYLFIHSYGGDLDQCHTLIDIICSSRIPIVTVAMGVAMSAGFMIFLAGYKRYAFKHSNLMVHKGQASISGTPDQIEQAQKNYKRQLNDMKEFILARTEIQEKVFNRNANKDWFLTIEELEKYKVVDKIIDNFTDIFADTCTLEEIF